MIYYVDIKEVYGVAKIPVYLLLPIDKSLGMIPKCRSSGINCQQRQHSGASQILTSRVLVIHYLSVTTL